MSDAEVRRLRAKIADVRSLIAGQESNAENQDRQAASLLRKGNELKSKGKYLEGTDLERQAAAERSSASNTRNNLWRLQNELKGLERLLGSQR